MNAKFEKKYKGVLYILVFVIGVTPWVVYALMIPVGLDSLVDEGLTILMVNPDETPKYLTSQFGNVVKFIFRHFGYNVLTSFWTRFIFQILSVLIILFTSYQYLSKKCNLKINFFMYIGLFMLVASHGLYLFTKTLSYNHLQQLAILITISSLLLYEIYKGNKVLKYFFSVLIGFFSFLSIINISPSGLSVTFYLIILLGLLNYPSLREAFFDLLFILLGMLIALILFNFFVNDINKYYKELHETYIVISSLNRSYDSLSLFFNLFRSFLSLFVISIFSIGILSLFDFTELRFGKNVYSYLVVLCTIFILFIYSIKYTKILTLGFSEWCLAPLAIALFVNLGRINKVGWFRSETLITILMIGTPILAPFGTNLFITAKIGYYGCLWFIAAVILLKTAGFRHSSLVYILFFIMYASINIFQIFTFQNKSLESSVVSDKLKRLRNVYITPRQKEHFESLYDTLNRLGYKDGDRILAFQPDLMSVFSVNGKPGERVYFVPEDFLKEKFDSLPRFNFIILNDYSYGQINSFIKGWGFPQRYHRVYINSPDTVNYFKANESRILFCLKRE